jgi:hypothetical protein
MANEAISLSLLHFVLRREVNSTYEEYEERSCNGVLQQ